MHFIRSLACVAALRGLGRAERSGAWGGEKQGPATDPLSFSKLKVEYERKFLIGREGEAINQMSK